MDETHAQSRPLSRNNCSQSKRCRVSRSNWQRATRHDRIPLSSIHVPMKRRNIYIYIKQKLHIVDFFNQKIIITFRSIAQVPSPLIEGLFFSREKKTVFNGTVIEHDDHWRWRKEKEYEIVDGNYDSRKRLTLCTHVSLYFIIINTYIYISILRDSCHNV